MKRCPKCGGSGKIVAYYDVIKMRDVWDACGKCTNGWIYSESDTSKKKKCFIATAAFGNYNAPEVIYLSTFRDATLSQSVFGRSFIRAYYVVSPPFAAIIAKSDFLRSVVRKLLLQPMIFLLKQISR